MGRFRAAVRLLLVPTAFYLAAFCALTWPAMRFFSTRFFHGGGDGWYNAWALWWFERAVAQLGQSPFHTQMIRYPHGTSLLGTELVNGGLGVVLQRFLTLLEAHNALLVLSFVLSGLTAFWLCYRVTRSLPASLAGGYVFTFCNYRFAHAEGHLGLLTTQFIPLFLLAFGAFLESPRALTALAAAAALALVLFSNLYYFLFCVGAGALLVLWHAARRRDLLFPLRPGHRGPWAAFVLAACLTSGPLTAAIMAAEAHDPLEGTPDRRTLSLDALAPFIPGGHWRFAEATRSYWSALPGNIHEHSVHLGLSVCALLGYVWWRRRGMAVPSLGFWYLLLLVFLVLALGPTLQVWGRQYMQLPQALLYDRLPPLRPFSAPVRLVVMSVLAASVLVACGLAALWREGRKGRILAVLFLAVMVVEYLPRPLPLAAPEVPGFVHFLRAQPGPGAVVDQVSSRWYSLYGQTVHGRPLLGGHVARLPRSALESYNRVMELVNRRDYHELSRRYGFRYLVLPRTEAAPAARLVYEDAEVAVYDLMAG